MASSQRTPEHRANGSSDFATACQAAALASAIAFALTFDPEINQRSDWLWPLSLMLWCSAPTSPGLHKVLRRYFDRTDLWSLAAVLAIFALVWLPHCTNWRWAYTGDTLAWFEVAEVTATLGHNRSLLNLWGIDNHFTNLHSHSHNVLLFLIQPTFFWHRTGNLIVTLLSLSAIFAFFRLLFGRPWALSIVATLAINYFFLWFTFVSYPHIDSFIFYYGTLALGVCAWRSDGEQRLWTTAGLLSGLSLSFTQTSWTGVAAAAGIFAILARHQRRAPLLAAYVVTGVLAGLPIILQAADLPTFIGGQTKAIWEWGYLSRIFGEIFLFPHDSTYDSIGVLGGVFRQPAGLLYLAGTGMALASTHPQVRRHLHIPPATPWIALLFFIEMLLMTITNNSYSEPSTKRVYNLLPLQAFMVTLPLASALRMAQTHAPNRSVLCVAAALAAGVYSWGNLRTIVNPPRALYGFNTFDGLIEVHQRLPDLKVTFFSSSDHLAKELSPGGLIDRAYGVSSSIQVRRRWSVAAIAETCREQRALCFDAHFDGDNFEHLEDRQKAQLDPLPVRNSLELRCYTCAIPIDESARASGGP